MILVPVSTDAGIALVNMLSLDLDDYRIVPHIKRTKDESQKDLLMCIYEHFSNWQQA